MASCHFLRIVYTPHKPVISHTSVARTFVLRQESTLHGHGFFAAKDFDVSCASVPVEGSFVAYDTEEQMLLDIAKHGGPRFSLCGVDPLRWICATHESVRGRTTLALKPEPTNPWFT